MFYIEGQADYFDIYSGNTLIGCCDMDDEAALPFYLSDGKVYYGKNGDEHRSIGYDIIGVQPEYIFGLNDGDEIEKYESMRDAAADKVRAGKNALPGRIWTHIRTSNNTQFNFSVMSFWGYNSEINNKVDRNLIRQIIDHVGVDENNLFITKFDDKRDQGTLVKYTEWDAYVPKMSDTQKKAYAIHLMKSKDKHNATVDFRTNRDRNIGKKLTNDKGQEMPVAQYRNIIYGENKQINTYLNMNKKLIRLTESDLHRIVKESVNRILREMEEPYDEYYEDDGDFGYGKRGDKWYQKNKKTGDSIDMPGDPWSARGRANAVRKHWLDKGLPWDEADRRTNSTLGIKY